MFDGPTKFLNTFILCIINKTTKKTEKANSFSGFMSTIWFGFLDKEQNDERYKSGTKKRLHIQKFKQ